LRRAYNASQAADKIPKKMTGKKNNKLIDFFNLYKSVLGLLAGDQ